MRAGTSTLDPVRSVLQDKALRERLFRENLVAAFADELQEQCEGLADLGEQATAEMREDILRCCLECSDVDSAFLAFKSIGWYARGGAYFAFEELFERVDDALARTVADRGAQLGYKGPVAAPAFVQAGSGSVQPSEGIAIPHPVLARSGEMLFVPVEIGAETGTVVPAPQWVRIPWHHVLQVFEGQEVPEGLAEKVIEAFEGRDAVELNDNGDEPISLGFLDFRNDNQPSAPWYGAAGKGVLDDLQRLQARIRIAMRAGALSEATAALEALGAKTEELKAEIEALRSAATSA